MWLSPKTHAACAAMLFHLLAYANKFATPPNKKALTIKIVRVFVIRIGFEPMTYCLEGSCSIQLSYRTNFASQKY